MGSQTRSVVRHTKLGRRAVAAGLEKLDAMCASGASCQVVQASPMGVAALDDLQASVAVMHAAVSTGANAVTSDRALTRAVTTSFAATAATLRVYERAVDDIADGDAAIITAAGLLARDVVIPRAALGDMTAVTGKPGKLPAQAILAWPAVKGAAAYAVEVSFTPETMDGPWTALANARLRRRVVTAPAPGVQILARVAAVDAYGTQTAWSPSILVTAR